MGQMERAILAELPSDSSTDRISSVAWQVARRLGWGIWTLDNHMGKLRKDRDEGRLTSEQYAMIAEIVPRLHREHPEKLENKFSASFSRALKRLEEEGLIDRFQETGFEREGEQLFYVMYKVKGPPRRCRTVRVRLRPRKGAGAPPPQSPEGEG